MLEVTIITDSPVADIFACKCCGGSLPDQNLEILIFNRGTIAVAIQSRLRLENGPDALDWEAVCPAGGRQIPPGEVAALYTRLDPSVLERYRDLVLFDRQDGTHRFPLAGPTPVTETREKTHDVGIEP